MIKISENEFGLIDVGNKEVCFVIDIFSKGSGERILHVGEQSNLYYIFIAKENCDVTLTIKSTGPHMVNDIRGICLGTAGSQVKLNLKSSLHHNHAFSHVHIVSFNTDDSSCTVNGEIFLDKDISQSAGDLLEENILLGEKIQIRTIPMLDVRSNDIRASHGATVQRMDKNKLFYLTSKGISTKEAKELMIRSYFEKVFEVVSSEDGLNDIKEKYLQELLSSI